MFYILLSVCNILSKKKVPTHYVQKVILVTSNAFSLVIISIINAYPLGRVY